MKNAILALFLYAATSAVCQSTAPAPLDPHGLTQAPPTVTQPWMNLGKLRSGEQAKAFVLPRIIVNPKITAAQNWNDAQMDPRIIVHPSQSRLGVQPPGTQVAHNEFSNLQMLPIHSLSAKLQATPTQWPSYSVKAISTRWPKFKLLPVDSDPLAILLTPAE